MGSGEPWRVFEEEMGHLVGLAAGASQREAGGGILGGRGHSGCGLCDWGVGRAPVLGGSSAGRAALWARQAWG